MVAYELPWDGKPFQAPVLAFDTETAIYDRAGREYDLSREIQPVVLATVSDGFRSAVLEPGQLPEFLLLHSSTLFVGHNIQFDYWVVHEYLRKTYPRGCEEWQEKANQGLLDDTMLLDFLVRLGSPSYTGSHDGMRDLGLVAQDFGYSCDKGSAYRKRFHEIRDPRTWAGADRGFFDYATEDSRVTWLVYEELLLKARRILMQERAFPRWDLVERYGPLTSRLQTRASIALAQVGRNGMAVDSSRACVAEEELRKKVAGLITWLDALEPPLFGQKKKNKSCPEGRVIRQMKVARNSKSGLPSMSTDSLTRHLLRECVEQGIPEAGIPRTPKTGKLSLSADFWRNLLPESELVQKWAELVDTGKLLQFLKIVREAESIHPSFRPLVRTGRTSCHDPNLQQMPREAWFRSLFVARPGHVFIIADYSAIELVTLAAVLRARFGQSTLADVLQQGLKPHDYTASLITGIPYEEMVKGVKEEKRAGVNGPFSRNRQAAKAVNFGVPGGLGAEKLAAYAKANYGVEFGIEQAREFKRKLITEVYPELSLYLQDDRLTSLARNLNCDRGELLRGLGIEPGQEWKWSRWIDDTTVRGGVKRQTGRHYSQSIRQRIWGTLQRLNKNPQLDSFLSEWRSQPSAAHFLVGQTVTTLTGRVRAGADYGEAHNTPFQGLAADGAKVALWRLHSLGYKIVNFVHDELIIEAPEELVESMKRGMVSVMKESMGEVIQCELPVEVEATISKTWSK